MSSRSELAELSAAIGGAITIGLGQVRSDADPIWTVLDLLIRARDAVETQRGYDPGALMQKMVDRSVARRAAALKIPDPGALNTAESAILAKMTQNAGTTAVFSADMDPVTATRASTAPLEEHSQHDPDPASSAPGASAHQGADAPAGSAGGDA